MEISLKAILLWHTKQLKILLMLNWMNNNHKSLAFEYASEIVKYFKILDFELNSNITRGFLKE